MQGEEEEEEEEAEADADADAEAGADAEAEDEAAEEEDEEKHCNRERTTCARPKRASQTQHERRLGCLNKKHSDILLSTR